MEPLQGVSPQRLLASCSQHQRACQLEYRARVGWRFSPSPYLANVDQVAFVRRDEQGDLWEQTLVPRPEEWFKFKDSLLGDSDVDFVSIGVDGLITITYRGEQLNAMSDFAVEPTEVLNKPDRPLVFLNAGDQNGDGRDDYYVYYSNGRRQLIYILPQQ